LLCFSRDRETPIWELTTQFLCLMGIIDTIRLPKLIYTRNDKLEIMQSFFKIDTSKSGPLPYVYCRTCILLKDNHLPRSSGNTPCRSSMPCRHTKKRQTDGIPPLSSSGSCLRGGRARRQSTSLRESSSWHGLAIRLGRQATVQLSTGCSL
jgi:hypothetical protein